MQLSEAALWHMPGLMAIKDIDSKYLMSNKTMVDILAYRNLDQLVGKTDFDLPVIVSQYADAFEHEDKLTLQNGKLKTLTIMLYPDHRRHVWLTDKFAVYDDAGNAVQYGFRSIELPYQSLQVINVLESHQAKKGSRPVTYTFINEDFRPFDLSDKHYSVLFYFLRKLSSDQTASKMGLTSVEIDETIQQLKDFFNCQNDSQLRDYALNSKLQSLLPKGILS